RDPLRHPHSFPTRRSSDLQNRLVGRDPLAARCTGVELVSPVAASRRCDNVGQSLLSISRGNHGGGCHGKAGGCRAAQETAAIYSDRKSTRLNSSHVKISYA